MDEGEDIKEISLKISDILAMYSLCYFISMLVKENMPKERYGRYIEMIVESIEHNLELWND